MPTTSETTFASEKEQLASELQRDAIDAQAGDADALARIWEDAIPLADACAKRYAKKYDWISEEDLSANLVASVPQVLARYNPQNNAAVPWGKYLYHSLHFIAKDVLRKEDPLGIKWPQKKQYPKWNHLSDNGLEHFDISDHREILEPDEMEFLVALAETEKVNDSIRDELNSFVSCKGRKIHKYVLRRRLKVKAQFGGKYSPMSFRRKYIHSVILAKKAERRVAARDARRQEKQQEKDRKAAEREALSQERALLPNRRRRRKKTMETTQAESQPAEQPAELELEPVQHGVINGHAAALPASQPAEQPAKKPIADARRADYAARGRKIAATKAANFAKKKSRRPPAEMNASKLIAMAIAFSGAAGGLRKAIQLLEQVESLK